MADVAMVPAMEQVNDARPSRGRRWWPALAITAGLLLTGFGLFSYLNVHAPPNPTPGAANPTIDCGSAYGPGSISRSPCRELLDDAARNGALALSAGMTLFIVGVGVIVAQVGFRRAWPYLAIVVGLIGAGAFVWVFKLPLDGGKCGSISGGTEGSGGPGDPCSDARQWANWAASILVFVSPALVLTGVAVILSRAVQARWTED
jgi:hypothetical protein